MDLGLQFDFVVRSTDSTGLNAIPLDLVQKANLLLEVKKAPLVWEMAVDIFAKSKRLPSFHNIQREAPARLFDLEKNINGPIPLGGELSGLGQKKRP